ncbi:MAG: molecular chaperone HtpG [Oligoflexia bacterium]|nr:molecular chaperone HtpG [Oligoflexia bacterium]
MSERKGTISVSTQDIFPIIKKWLYSEHDIFLRELIANATDAITKRASFSRTENLEIPTGAIEVLVDKSQGIVQIKDNGLGMTEEEVEKYIAQLAFSGAQEFVDKMNKETEGADIIGKFGLGFYSAFMVASKVEVETLSWQKDAKPTKWTCDGETEYVFTDSDKKDVGTTITLHINEESKDFLNDFKLVETLKRYCDFMPYQIVVTNLEKRLANESAKEEKDRTADTWDINDTQPLWKRDPKELKDEDYKKFYRQLFPMDQEPLFWIHLKVDHPFTLEGILYFPKINPKMAFQEKNIRLYSKQVFVSDNVKDIIPEFLSLLKGSIDSTDIPLNVSRSSLQGDPNVKKISNYIIKKVAESLKKLFRQDREKFERIWEDTGLFVKYGCISDTKFDEMMRDMVIFKNADEKMVTIPEYFEGVPADLKEKVDDKIIYFEKDKSDPSLKKNVKELGLFSIEVDDHIDPHFMQHAEAKPLKDTEGKETKVAFVSIDSEAANLLESEKTTAEDMKVQDLFKKILVGELEKDEDAKASEQVPPNDGRIGIEIQKMKNASIPAYFKVDEQMKRFAKMAESMGQNNSFPIKKTLVINPNNSLIKSAMAIHEKGNNEGLVDRLCHHVEDLALISSEGLANENKEDFVQRTQDLVNELSQMVIQ